MKDGVHQVQWRMDVFRCVQGRENYKRLMVDSGELR